MKAALLLASSLIALATAAKAQTIAPGSGTLTDAAGHKWTVTESGSIMSGDQYTPGGGGTSALTIMDGTVYGEDSSGRGWFALSSDGRYWTSSATPASVATARPAAMPLSVTQPAASPTTTSTLSPVGCGGTADKNFGVLPLQDGGAGQIIGSDGKVFVPRGIGIMEAQEPSLQTLRANFPGINFVRYAIYQYPDAAKIAPWVNSLTAAGIVVEIENHSNGAGNSGGAQGAVFSGQQLQNESSWYTATASYFKGNARVWFGTNNEPPGPGGALSQWHLATYNAIRATGNNSIILIDPVGAYLTDGLDPSVYAQMTNVAWDVHFYGWGANYSTDAGTVKSTLAGFIKNVQALKSAGGVTMPVIIGEYGDSTDGYKIDPNGMIVVQVVHDAVTSGIAAGSAAWVWAPPMPGDGLVQGMGGGVTSPYGTTVAAYVQKAMQVVDVCKPTSGQADAPNATKIAAALIGSDSADSSQDSATAPVQPVAPAAASAGITDQAPMVQATEGAVQQALTGTQAQEQQLQAQIQYLQSLAATGQAMPPAAGPKGQ